MSREFCQACSNEKFGVKTRLAVPHTCGRTWKEREEIRKLDEIEAKDFQKWLDEQRLRCARVDKSIQEFELEQLEIRKHSEDESK